MNPADPLAAALADRYRIEREVGQGGMSQETAALYRISAPNRLVKLGTVPRPVSGLHASEDARRVTVQVRDFHGDAWMSKVVRP